MRVAAAFFAIISLLAHGVTSSAEKDEPAICGPDLDSSLRVGCVLDVAGLHWTPPECFNQRLSESSLESVDISAERQSRAVVPHEFNWFKDANKTQRLDSLEELQVHLIARAARGDDIFAYTHASWHPTHCMYISKIAAIAIEKIGLGQKNVYVPDMASQPDHGNHCERIIDHIMQNAEWTKEPFKVKFGFTRCVKLS